MKDHYAWLVGQRQPCPTAAPAVPRGLAPGFVDDCTAWSASGNGSARNDARRCYIKHVDGKTGLSLPSALNLEPDFRHLPPDTVWIGLEVEFTLETPWYSKDDRPFHVLDNPVRKDRVFGVPFMAAASWKGLLRWACRMRGMAHGQVLHLFGNDKGEVESFQRGALAFYSTWFDRLGFEVINPHSRKTRAGTQPIYYEVVPARAEGVLHLLYAPPPARADEQRQNPAAVRGLIDAIDDLLPNYGISAKRTAGWGTARPTRWRAFCNGKKAICASSASEFAKALEPWMGEAA